MTALAGIALIIAGVINLLVGFLALFPGLFEAGLTTPAAEADSFLTLLTTKYGLFALGHLVGAALQIAGGSNVTLIARPAHPLAHLLVVLIAVSFGLEAWGWLFKESITVLAVPGFVAGLACVFVYYACWGRAETGDGS
jgi:hypothetical protein